MFKNINPRLAVEIGYALIAMAGGAARYLENYLETGKFEIGKFVSNIFVSGFSGYIFAHFAQIFGMSSGGSTILAGLGGFMGAKSVEFIFNRITKE